MADKKKTFEEKLIELDDIVKTLEGGETTLDEMLSLFEQGVKITRECTSELENAEQKISILVKDKDSGEMKPEPFAAETEE